MNVRSLAILQFFGVGKTEPKVELTDLGDVNIIYGPNGAGKTVTTRALGAIFWRNSEQEARPYIHAEVEAGSECWHISIEGGRYTSTPPNPPVTLPDGHRSRYFLSLHDLLRAEDADLAKVIQEEMQGGSLEEAADKLGFSRTEPNRSARERRDVDAAANAVNELVQKQAALSEKEHNLQQLRDKLTQAQVAGRKLAVYTLLEKARDEHAALRNCEERVDQFLRDYPGISDYQANDLEQYTHALSGLRDAEASHAATSTEMGDAQERQQALFPAGQQPPAAAGLATLTDRLEAWTALEQQRGEKAAALQSAGDAERDAQDDIQQEEEAIRQLQAQAAGAPATLEAEPLALLDNHVIALRQAQGRLEDISLQRRQHDEQLANAEARVRETEEGLQQASQAERLALARWNGTPPQAGELAGVEQQIHDLKLTTEHLTAAIRAQEVAHHRVEQTRSLVAETLSDEHLRAINQQITSAGLDRLLEKSGDLHACEQVLALLRGMASEAEPAMQDWLKSAVRILEDWIGTAPVARITLPTWWAPAYWGATIVITGVALLGCQRLPGGPVLVLVPIAAFVILLVIGLTAPKLLAPEGRNDQQEHEGKYRQLGTPPSGVAKIDAWERAAVQVRLGEYREKLVECAGKAKLNAELEMHRRQQEGNRTSIEEELRRLRQELRAQIGFDGPESATALARLIHQLVLWQQAHGDAAAQDKVVQELDARVQQQLADLGRVLTGWGCPKAPANPTDVDRAFADVRAALSLLEQKSNTMKDARAAVEQAKRQLADARRTVEFDEKQRIELLADCRQHAETIREAAAGCIGEQIDEENAATWVANLRERRKALDEIQRQIHEQEQLLRSNRQRRDRQHAAVEKITAELADIDRGIDELHAMLATAFTTFGEAEAGTASEAFRRVQSLQKRTASYDQATQAIADCEKRARDLASTMQRSRTTLEEISKRLGLETGTDAEARARNEQRLRRLAETAKAFTAAGEERVKAATRYEGTRQELERCDGYAAALREWSPEQLLQAKTTAALEAESIETLQRTITEIEFEVDRTRRQHDLEQAIVRQEAAKAKLLHLRDAVVRQHTGDLLVEWLRSESDHNASEVLRQARALFSEITAGRYELKVSYLGERPHFEAIDTRDPHAPRTLAMLSSATRIQLLIAVRLAFLEVQEAGSTRLPLVLDEVLGNSDDQRAEVVVDSILKAIAAPSRRRQLFYLTGQADEVAKWQSRQRAMAAGAAPIPLRWNYQVIGSERLPAGQAAAITELLPAVAIPAPVPGMSYEAYGRELGIPAFNPAAPANTAHLWYVLSQPEELYQALQRRISTVGQLERLLTDGGAIACARLGISERECFATEVQQAIAIIRCLCDTWRDYHGTPITPDLLDASPIAATTYYSNVVELAQECRGDATRFLTRLPDIPRIRRTSIDNLITYLQERECLPRFSASLTPETIHTELNTRLCAAAVVPGAAAVETLLARLGMDAAI